jgi:hypothetical protein
VPTTLPTPPAESHADDRPAGFCRTLLFFYGALAIVLLSITAVEIQLGVYAESTVGYAILKTIGTALVIGGVVSPAI